MEKKYELVPTNNKFLFRIKALRNFSDIKKGDIGGYVESENNLSHEGDCWIYDDSHVTCDVKILDNARIYGNCHLYGSCTVCDNAIVKGNININGTYICNNARIIGNNITLSGSIYVSLDVLIKGNNIFINGDDIEIKDRVNILDNVDIHGCNIKLYNNAIIENVDINNVYLFLGKDVEIHSNKDFITFREWWYDDSNIIWLRKNDKYILGKYCLTSTEFITYGSKLSKNFGCEYSREYKRIVDYIESIKSSLND